MSTISKDFTFSAGSTIIASEHNANLNTIYNDYNGNITDANIASGAAIADGKLDLASIAQSVAFNGPVTFSGITIADLGTVTTANIDGGTIDGTTIGATSASTVKGSTFEGASGTTVNEFSIDGTFAGNSDDAVPTEKAVKTYVTANAESSYYSSDPSLLFSFSNSEGAATDGSSYNWDVTPTSLAIADLAVGPTGRLAYQYNDSPDQVDVETGLMGAMNGLANLTVEAAFVHDVTATEYLLESTTQDAVKIRVEDTNIICSLTVNNGTASVTAAHGVTEGNSGHVVITWDSSTLTVYVNGSSVGTDATKSGVVTLSTEVLIIGAGFDSDNHWTGIIDGVRIYNSVMGATEVSDRFTNFIT